MDERKRRIGENEVLFREVNERVEALNEAFNAISDRVSIVCECGHIECIERISMTLREYEAVRADAATFAVRPGHELPEAESVVTKHDDYYVVRKHPGPSAEFAVQEDPRG